MPSHVVARLLREATGITDLDEEAARARVHGQSSDADDDDLLLVYDLLGVRETDQAMPNIDPDAQRRRLTTLINVDGLDFVTIEHVDRIADDLAPDWPKGRTGGTDGIWRVLIDGEPSIDAEFEVGHRPGESHNDHGLLATGMRAVNAIPWVCDAEPGIVGRAAHPAHLAGGRTTSPPRRDPRLLRNRHACAVRRVLPHEHLVARPRGRETGQTKR